jgi:ATP-dependent protease ClpP protease subunit
MKRTQFKNRSNGEAEIFLYDEIGGWGVTANQFKDGLLSLGDVKTITLNLSSPGGDVFDGAAIFNLLAKHEAKVIVSVDGMALSAASVVMMAGDEIKLAENAMVMIHDPWSITAGDAAQMRKTADLLDTVKGTIIGVYAARTKNSEQQLAQWMSAETWWTAAEAKAVGFGTEIVPNKSVAASAAMSDRIKAIRNDWTKVKADPRLLRECLLLDPPEEEKKDEEPLETTDTTDGTADEIKDHWRVKLARRRQEIEALRA